MRHREAPDKKEHDERVQDDWDEKAGVLALDLRAGDNRPQRLGAERVPPDELDDLKGAHGELVDE